MRYRRIGALVVTAAVLSACGTAHGDVRAATQYVVTTSGTVSPTTYTVVESAKRSDGKPAYYVRVDTLDVDDERFKVGVVEIISNLAHRRGDADFSAFVFDDKLTAAHAYVNRIGIRDQEQSEYLRTQQTGVGRHFIASFIGGDDANATGTQLSWFPAARTDTPRVGQWVGTTDWNPLST